MHAELVAGDEPGDPVRYAVVLHVLMSRAEIEMWESVAARCGVEVDDVVHVSALSGLKYQLAHDGDDVRAHVAEACIRELIAWFGVEGCDVHHDAGPGRMRPQNPRWG